MNFLTRNLGWLLLLLFFLFMLFVISSNDVKKENSNITNIQSGATVINNISDSEDVDVLEEMLDDEEKDTANNKDEQKAELIEDTQEEKQGFFSRLFGKSKTQENETEVVDIEDITIVSGDNDENASEDVQEEVEIESVEEEKQGFFSKIFGKNETTESSDDNEMTIEKGNLVKDTGVNSMSETALNTIHSYAPEILEPIVEYPGTDLETTPGKSFEIGVYSLKLNNKYFNETLAYMLKGDVVRQITQENSRGCFEVELMTSHLDENIGKTGFVCKKYLQEVGSTQASDNTPVETKDFPVSQVGDKITIEASTVEFGEGIVLIQGDVIDQTSPTDENGCFGAHVFYTQNISYIVPVGNICYSDIK